MPRLLLAAAMPFLAAAIANAQPIGNSTGDASKSAPLDKAPQVGETKVAGSFHYRPQTVDPGIKVGYGVCVADVNGDNKPDIAVADTDRIVWYENPGTPGADWKRRIIHEGEIKPNTDNVTIAAADIDGDGKIDFAVGAGWRPFNATEESPIVWFSRAESLDSQWNMHPIASEPSVHRIRFVDLDGDGKPSLVVAPLMGRGSTAKGFFNDGKPVRVLAFKPPADPIKGPWQADVLNDSLHVVHGICAIPAVGRKGSDLLTASFEGVNRLSRDAAGHWSKKPIGEGNQSNLLSSRGSSEVRYGKLRSNPYIATIEPWHGNQVVVYVPDADEKKPWERKVVDSRLRWGHALWCADLDGDGEDELIVGVRDDPLRGDEFKDPRGVRIYKSRDGHWGTSERMLVDPGNVAVEDLAVADLDGDGRPDIIAVGRQSGNLKIYWNVK